MNIRQIIKYLERKPADKIVPIGFSSPGAYRGDYKCLGVEPIPDVSVGDMLFAVRYALGTTYYGWEGGSCMMMPGTNVYLAPYSKTGKLITREMLDEMLNVHDKNVVVCPRTLRQLDAALKAMNVSYCVHHTLLASPMPRAVTIAKKGYVYEHDLNMCLLHIDRAISRGDVADGESVGAFVKHQLARYGYKHVAVCSRGDEFSQTRGELIALGRLLKAQRKHDQPMFVVPPLQKVTATEADRLRQEFDLPFDRRQLPALPSRRRNPQRRHVIGCRTATGYVSSCNDCVLKCRGDLCKLYLDGTAAKPRYSDVEETTTSPPTHDDPTQDVVIGCRTRDGRATTCNDCMLTYGSNSCMTYRDDTAAKPRYADAEETTTSPPPRDDTEQDVVIGCGRSLEYHTSDDPSHFMFCRDCSYTYSNDPDSKCSRYRMVYSLIGPRHIIRAYESDE